MDKEQLNRLAELLQISAQELLQLSAALESSEWTILLKMLRARVRQGSEQLHTKLIQGSVTEATVLAGETQGIGRFLADLEGTVAFLCANDTDEKE